MFFYEGLSCPHCEKPFGETDDIVACPQCGAPHHRECWKENGGCACAEAHGTDRQWSRETALSQRTPDAETVPCPHCGADNSPYAELCAHCGRELHARQWQSEAKATGEPAAHGHFNEYTPFHTQPPFADGVDPHETIEGESARDLAAFVRSNTPYYLKRFKKMAQSSIKASWNWPAFLIPAYWLLFRKQYLIGAMILLLDIAQIVIGNLVMYKYFDMSAETYEALLRNMLETVEVNPQANLAVMLFGLMGIAIFFVHLSMALFGNRIYMKSCLSAIRRTREGYPEGYQAQLATIGGTSFILAAIGYMCQQTLPSLIIMLLLGV